MGSAPAVPDEKRQALSAWPTSPLFGDAERVALGFAEQFVIDVAGISADQRSAVAKAFGREALVTLAVAMFVLDYDLRARLVFERLSVRDPERAEGRIRKAARGDDRGADGRRCSARRSRQVPARGGPVDWHRPGDDASSFGYAVLAITIVGSAVRSGPVRRWERPATKRGSIAPNTTNRAISTSPRRWRCESPTRSITEPTAIDSSLAATLRALYTNDQIVELVLDVVRNSSQKIAVALGADDPHVATGTELFDLAPDGTVVFLG